MTRRGITPEPERDSDGEGLDASARVRLRRPSLTRVLDGLYKSSAIAFWLFTGVAVVRAAPGAYAVARDATAAMTRVSVALERATEGTARIEAATERGREEQREMRREMAERLDRLSVTCARCETGRR